MTHDFTILYLSINEQLSSKENGVSKKLISKVEALGKYCSGCILLNAIYTTHHTDVKILEKGNLFSEIEIGVKEANTGYLNKINCDKLFYKKLGDYIKEQNISCNRIIFRYPLASLGLLAFTKKNPGKIVFEHNTKEIEELQGSLSTKKHAPFSLRPSGFFYWLQEMVYPVYCEKRIAKKIFGYAYAGACVTSEIARYEQKRNPAYRTFVSSNFYTVSEASLSTSHYKEGDILTLGIITSTTAPWYGLDRLLKSFAIYQDNYKLIIAGIEKDNTYITGLLKKYKITKNVDLLGKINQSDLLFFYNSVQVCFGSLALYTINLNYASTLKVKESVAFGIPVVIGYYEEDFVSHEEFKPYYLQVENADLPIDFESIKSLALRFYAEQGSKTSLKNLALQYMNVDVKMKKLVDNIKP
jgi:hypothetical protein